MTAALFLAYMAGGTIWHAVTHWSGATIIVGALLYFIMRPLFPPD